MRVLHVSHNGLPDPRVEKLALSMKKLGHTIFFIGGQTIRYQNLDAFEETHFLPVTNAVRIVFSKPLCEEWLTAIHKLKPDVIHAHNIIAAQFAMRAGYPMIYDDHEYWSKSRYLYRAATWKGRLFRQPYIQLIPIWERSLVKKYPTLVTHDNVAADYRRHGGWVGVVKNFPHRDATGGLNHANERNGVVYLGSDFERPGFAPHRDMTGLQDTLVFEIVCGLPHKEMMTQLTRYKVGLTPWRPHPVLVYKDQNRNYEYLHAGLQVVASEQIKAHFPNDSFVHGYRTYDDINDVIAAVPDVAPADIAKHAEQHYLWEHQEPTIYEAYERALT